MSDERLIFGNGLLIPDTGPGLPVGPALPFMTETPFRIVSVCAFQGRLFLATERHCYELIDGVWVPMVFVAIPDEPPPASS